MSQSNQIKPVIDPSAANSLLRDMRARGTIDGLEELVMRAGLGVGAEGDDTLDFHDPNPNTAPALEAMQKRAIQGVLQHPQVLRTRVQRRGPARTDYPGISQNSHMVWAMMFGSAGCAA